MTSGTEWRQAFPDLPFPTAANRDAMWGLMEELFPIYRSLLGPGFQQSLEIISKSLELEIAEFPSGQEVFDWIIPQEFKVNEAWVEDPDGNRVLDFNEHPYCVWIYSRPFDGVLDKEELLEHVTTNPELPDAYPMRQTYYRDGWGLSAPDNVLQRWKPGKYKVHIDTELYDGHLRIGQAYLPGNVEDEILICSYLCHPRGANDNLSGVVTAVELFRMLAALPERHYSYRLALWPETIGAITYIASYPDRLKKMIGGFHTCICGDTSPVGMDETYRGDSIFDRAVRHAMPLSGVEPLVRKFNIYGGDDPKHFNSIGLRLPMVNITRAGSRPGGYAEYHSSADDLNLVSPDALLETLDVAYTAALTVERTRTYKGTYTTTPFLSRHGVFPYQHGWGVGGYGTMIGDAYYAIMPEIDGNDDLLAIAERAGMPIFAFDECVSEFKRVGLLEET